MSRKWERMVEKNRKTVNRQRKKFGQAPITEAGSEQIDRFLGRSWILPLILELFALLFLVLFSGYYKADSTYLFTIICYFLLGVFIFFVRRPVLSVSKSKLATRRLSGDKVVEAHEVDRIELFPKHIVVTLKHKNKKWMFSRTLHMFHIAPMADRLRKFAAQHQIPLHDSK